MSLSRITRVVEILPQLEAPTGNSHESRESNREDDEDEPVISEKITIKVNWNI